MAIQTQCEHCGFQYVASNEIAGRRVRCRQCGLVFAIPQPEQQLYEQHATDELSASDLSGDTRIMAGPTMFPRDSSETKAMGPIIEKIESNMSGGVGSAKSRMERNADAEGFDLMGEYSGGSGLRPSRPFTFPMADLLDDWLPWASLVLMLGWAGLQIWGWHPVTPSQELTETAAKMPSWYAAVPLGLFLLVLLALWLPVFSSAMQKTSKKVGQSLPYGHGKRALSMAAIPLSMAAVFWFGAESIPAAVTGAVLGGGLAFLASWFLYRFRQSDLGYAAIGVGIATLGCVILTVALVAGANYALQQTLRATHNADLFERSPVGPEMAWDMPPQTKAPVASASPSTGTSAPSAAVQPTTAVRPAVTEDPPQQPVASRNPTDSTVTPTPDTTAPRQNPSVVARTPANTDSGSNTPPSRAGTPASPAGVEIPDDFLANNPSIAEAKILSVPQLQSQLVTPVGASSYLANVLLTASLQNRIFEVYDIRDMSRVGRISVPYDSQFPTCALAPDGDRLVTLGRGLGGWEFQVRSLKENKILQKIPVGQTAQVRILGFVSNTTMLVESRTMGYELALIDTTLTKQYKVGSWPYDAHAWPVALWTDSAKIENTRMAVVAMRNRFAEVRVYRPTVLTTVEPTVIGLDGVDPAIAFNPTGIAFSPDGKHVAVSYEPAGNVAVVVMNVADKKIVATHTFAIGDMAADATLAGPAGADAVFGGPPAVLPPVGAPPMGFTPRAITPMNQPGAMGSMQDRLQWLSGDRWLYSGRFILDSKSETVVASLEPLGKSLQQKTISPDSFLLLIEPQKGGTPGLVQVKLKAQSGETKPSR